MECFNSIIPVPEVKKCAVFPHVLREYKLVTHMNAHEEIYVGPQKPNRGIWRNWSTRWIGCESASKRGLGGKGTGARSPLSEVNSAS